MKNKYPWIVVAVLALVIIAIAGMGFYQQYQDMYEAAHYSDGKPTHCSSAPTNGIVDWKIDCNDGYTYDRVPERTAEQKEADEEAARIAYENSVADWLAKNPPVKELFDMKRLHDTAYVIQYLKDNPIAGQCAMIFRTDVVCTDLGRAVIFFPTSRTELNY